MSRHIAGKNSRHIEGDVAPVRKQVNMWRCRVMMSIREKGRGEKGSGKEGGRKRRCQKGPGRPSSSTKLAAYGKGLTPIEKFFPSQSNCNSVSNQGNSPKKATQLSTL